MTFVLSRINDHKSLFPFVILFIKINIIKLYYIPTSIFIYDFYFFFCRMVRLVAEEFLTDERDRKYYADNYRCCPPPLFILLITIFEVSNL